MSDKYDNLGTLKQVELREIWKHEAYDFTKWLAENLDLLSNEIGIDIEFKEIEAEVGSFNVDMLCEEEMSGRTIIIENQLEKTDHDHLGKIITYASGYDAEVIIWIVKEVRDEHKQAIDWLNENTNEKVNFFIVKMELWQIDNSKYSPKFVVVSQPNNWTKNMRKAVNNELSSTGKLKLEFWTKFKEYAENTKTKLRITRKPSSDGWYDISIGTTQANICIAFPVTKKKIRCELYINDSEKLYKRLFDLKPDIEKELGYSLNWDELSGKKASRISIEKDIDNPSDLQKWDEYFGWLLNKAEEFYNVFSEHIKL